MTAWLTLLLVLQAAPLDTVAALRRLSPAEAAQRQGRFADAAWAWEVVLALRPDDRAALSDRLDVLTRLEHWKQAVPLVLRLAELETGWGGTLLERNARRAAAVEAAAAAALRA